VRRCAAVVGNGLGNRLSRPTGRTQTDKETLFSLSVAGSTEIFAVNAIALVNPALAVEKVKRVGAEPWVCATRFGKK
jgi:hypothetical protein